MKILTAAQIRELEAFTIANKPISSFDLMAEAAEICSILMEHHEDWSFPTVFICGKGNNGGDGVAMALLNVEEEHSALVKVIILEHVDIGSAEFGKNLYLLEETGKAEIIRVRNMDQFPEIHPRALIVDAIMGIGITRPLEGLLADAVHRINTLLNTVVSIDIPSGVFPEDNTGNSIDNVIHASHTGTFHSYKLSSLLPDFGPCFGTMQLLDIELMDGELDHETHFEMVSASDVRSLIRTRKKFSHKGNYGHALLISGSKGKMGAAQLSAMACMRSGAGLLTAHVPSCGLDIMQLGVKEAMCTVDPAIDRISTLPELSDFNAIGIGPGIGTAPETASALKRLLQEAKVPLVLDADALNILGMNKDWLALLPKDSILTPHPKEFARMAGDSNSSYECLQKQMAFSQKYGVYVVLKGTYTSMSTPDGKVYFNDTGNPGMATAGSGDVLTGMILGFLAQGYSTKDAMIAAVHLHGRAGDLGVRLGSEESLVAGDIIDHIGAAFQHLNQQADPTAFFPFDGDYPEDFEDDLDDDSDDDMDFDPDDLG